MVLVLDVDRKLDFTTAMQMAGRGSRTQDMQQCEVFTVGGKDMLKNTMSSILKSRDPKPAKNHMGKFVKACIKL